MSLEIGERLGRRWIGSKIFSRCLGVGGKYYLSIKLFNLLGVTIAIAFQKDIVEEIKKIYDVLDYHGYNPHIIGLLALYLQNYVSSRIRYMEIYLDTERIPVYDRDLIRDLEHSGIETYSSDSGFFYIKSRNLETPIHIEYPLNGRYIPSGLLKIRNTRFIDGLKVVEAHTALILALAFYSYSPLTIAKMIEKGQIDLETFRSTAKYIMRYLSHSEYRGLVNPLKKRIDVFLRAYTGSGLGLGWDDEKDLSRHR